MSHSPELLLSLVDPLLGLCLQAGDSICAHYQAPGADQYESKGDDSPLTRADLDSHALLQAGLAALPVQLPLLSEESSPEEKAVRRQWPSYWLVDPLDGTKEFLARTGEFTINIALVEDHRPVLGLVYLPLEQQAYFGIPGLWARCYQREKSGNWTPVDLSTRSLRQDQAMTVLASRRHGGRRLQDFLDWMSERWDSLERRDSGSALKFCQLAEGGGDIYPRFSPCCEWDTAAGQALLEAAGGALVGMDGHALRYNCGDSLFSPNFFAIAQPGHALWQDLLLHVQAD